MSVSKATDTARTILRALGYTPKALAADIGVSVYQAKRILSDDGTIYLHEFMEICKVTGIKPPVMGGMNKPGTLREVEVSI